MLSNDELAAQIETSNDWIVTRTGIQRRHIAAEGEFTSDLAAEAARRALAHAGIGAGDVDLIVVATSTPDDTFPATATQVQAKLGLTTGAAFDVQAVCSGFVFALAVADNFIRAGQAETALVIGAETYSRILDWDDRGTCVLFGDGAGAVVVSRTTELAGPARNGQPPAILSTHLHSDGRHRDILYVDGGPSRTGTVGKLRMSGREVFRHAVSCLAQVAEEALAANGLAIADVDWLIPHQANKRILEGVAKKLSAAGGAGDLHRRDPCQHLGGVDPAGARPGRSRRPDRLWRPDPVRGHRRRPDLGRGAGSLVAAHFATAFQGVSPSP